MRLSLQFSSSGSASESGSSHEKCISDKKKVQQWDSKCRLETEKDTADRLDRTWTCLFLMFISGLQCSASASAVRFQFERLLTDRVTASSAFGSSAWKRHHNQAGYWASSGVVEVKLSHFSVHCISERVWQIGGRAMRSLTGLKLVRKNYFIF